MKAILLAIAMTGCQTTMHDLADVEWSKIEIDKPSTIFVVSYVSYIKWSHDKAKKRAERN